MTDIPKLRLSLIGRTKLFAALVLLGSAPSCSDRAPTSPSPALVAAVGVESVAPPVPKYRPVPRQVGSRGGSAPALQGVWGGEHIGLTITASGAVIEYDCAAGSIDEPFATDSSGRFSLSGTWWFTPPVVRIDWQPDKRPARYSGVVSGNTMILTVTRLDDNQASQFTLTQGTIPRLLRCL